MIEEMCLEVKPVRCYISTKRTLATVSSGMAATMHVEECTVTKHRTARAHEHRLSLTEVCQYLFVGEVCQQVHQMCIRTITAASSSVSHSEDNCTR